MFCLAFIVGTLSKRPPGTSLFNFKPFVVVSSSSILTKSNLVAVCQSSFVFLQPAAPAFSKSATLTSGNTFSHLLEYLRGDWVSSRVVCTEKQKNSHFRQKKKGESSGFSQHSSGIRANFLEGSGVY